MFSALKKLSFAAVAIVGYSIFAASPAEAFWHRRTAVVGAPVVAAPVVTAMPVVTAAPVVTTAMPVVTTSYSLPSVPVAVARPVYAAPVVTAGYAPATFAAPV